MKKLYYNQQDYDKLANIATVEDITPEIYKLFIETEQARTHLGFNIMNVAAGIAGVFVSILAAAAWISLAMGAALFGPIFGGSFCTLLGGFFIGSSIHDIYDETETDKHKDLRKALKKSKDWKRISALMQAYEQKQEKVDEQQFIAELKKSLEAAEKKKVAIIERNNSSVKKVDDEISLIKRMLSEKENNNNNTL